jgi:hypothetical protein
MAKKVRINLTVADDADIEQVAADAAALGLSVEQTMGALGVISGEVDEAQLEPLRKLAKVTALEEERTIELPKPGTPQ